MVTYHYSERMAVAKNAISARVFWQIVLVLLAIEHVNVWYVFSLILCFMLLNIEN